MIGRSLGPYRIDAPLGAGGMGEVYRATDTQLNRAVALKLLPGAVAKDPDRLARLRREAQTLAALNHPNVAQIYGLVDTGEVLALSMELVEGEELAAVLARGALPLDDALAIARQIAEALAAAHEQGIVHRDLKPANVKVRPDGTVKVLDFGLAKALETGGGVVSGDAVTLTSPAMTGHGVILGTAAYMSPEQARGKPVDRRADVWAFGVVLWEMLAGARLFPGETVSDTLAAVLTREPDLTAVPPRVRRLLAACLEKDPRKRLRDLGDAWLLLADGETAGASGRPRPVLPWALASLAAGALATWSLVALRPRPAPATTVFLEPAPSGTAFASAPIPSQDGRALALLVKTSSGESRLFTRDLDEEAARPVEGSAGAEVVFWSPDGRQLAFVGGGEVRRAARSGGPSSLVTAVPANGGVWLPDGDLLLAVPAKGFLRVPASGGTPRPAPGFDDPVFRDQQLFDMSLSPDGRTLLFRQFGGETGLYAARLDGSRRRLVFPGEQFAAFFVGDRHVVRRRDNVLVAQAFDPRTLTAAGDAIPVAKDVDRDNYAGSAGALCFVAGATEPTLLAWFDRTGTPQGIAAPEGQYSEVAISRRSGRWLAFSRQESGNVDVWVQSLLGGAPNRLTSDPDIDHLLTISDDERQLAWEAHAGGALNLMVRPPDGSTPERLVRRWGKGGGPCGWTPDSGFVLYVSEETAGPAVFAVPVDGKAEPVLVLPPATRAASAQVAPDGRLLAYAGEATGRREVYLQALDGVKLAGGPMRVSEDGGGWPLWRGDGKELYFLDRKNKLMAVEVDAASGRPAGNPRPLFTVPGLRYGVGWPYAVTPDGRRFVAITASSAAVPRAATVILGWRPAEP